MKNLVNKYNIAGPRYTSYPTVPYWDKDSFSLIQWKKSVWQSFSESNIEEGISVYIHLPFCESMCTFCGCTKRITKNHDVELPYLKAVIKEWQMYCDILQQKPRIQELHLGGGTPTFFSPENLQFLITEILKSATTTKDYAFSFEGHPNNTSKDHLTTLFNLGFKRVSYGVQDYNETVQRSINRVQPFSAVKNVTQLARELGFTSVGHDLIFGLPFQSLQDVKNTILKTCELAPDRIAFYSYAHVPWLKGNGQRGFLDEDLPSPSIKRAMYQEGKALLEQHGYYEIGMDHFALKSDSLYQAMQNNKLHRNFMGYTDSKTQLMIGLGASAISDSWYGFAQNVKGVGEYQNLIEKDIFPVFRGHILNSEDFTIRTHILNLMCNFETSWSSDALQLTEMGIILSKLEEMEKDQLITIEPSSLKVTPKGRPFIRNICMAFDCRLQRNKPETKLFSMTI
jgi:oxygen-independent coproporphyrinogen-3 oxidase